MIKRMGDSANGAINQVKEELRTQYHRPNDKWVEIPIQSSVDRETTMVTIRTRSLREKRRIFTLCCTAFTAGLLMIVMTSPYSKEFLVPGGLSSNHGQILAGQGADRCAACHANANGSLAGWIASSISLGKSNGLTQSELCMKCHDKTFAVDTSLNPHNVAPEKMDEISKKYTPAALDAGMIFQPPLKGHDIACSACHREHHGKSHDLAVMTDNQCQSCHQNSFHSFETNHPEFTSYPLSRRSRIAFDHASHSNVHFPGKQTAFNCNQCHIDDSFQNVKQLAPFEQACASCHNQQIQESGSDGLAFITLPMIDTQAIEGSKLKIGSWPMAATGDFDGVIPPIMRVLLSADPKAAEVLNGWGPDFEFSDIDAADEQQVKDAVEIVWATKRLLYDLSVNGQREIQTRLESVLDVPVPAEKLHNLVANLDERVFQTSVARWLPNLAREIGEHRRAKFSPAKLTPTEVAWWPSENDLLLNIGDDDLLAPNPLVGLMKSNSTGQATPQQTVNDDGAQTKGSNDTPVARAPEKKTNSIAQDTKPAKLEIRNAQVDLSSDPELLAVNPLQKMNGSAMNLVPNKEQGTDDLPTVLMPANPKTRIVHNRSDKGGADNNASPIAWPKNESPLQKWLPPSGWFRNDQVFNISYRSAGHADSCIKSWLELVSEVAESETRPETKQLFKKTLAANGFGLCRNCHTVDQVTTLSGKSMKKINWNSEYRDPSVRSFTKFAHGPHMIQSNLQDCSHCHQLDPDASNHKSFASYDSTEMVSNFIPIKKSNCTSCHQKSQTSNSCTQCHNYHVGSSTTGSK